MSADKMNTGLETWSAQVAAKPERSLMDRFLQTEATEAKSKAMNEIIRGQKAELDAVLVAYKAEKSDIVGKSNIGKAQLLSDIANTIQRMEVGGEKGVVLDAYEKLEAKITGTNETNDQRNVDFFTPEFITRAIENLRQFESALRATNKENTAADHTLLDQVDAARAARNAAAPAAPVSAAAATEAPAAKAPATTSEKVGFCPSNREENVTSKFLAKYPTKLTEASQSLSEPTGKASKVDLDETKKLVDTVIGAPSKANVQALQKNLSTYEGINISADGMFGPNTLNALLSVAGLDEVKVPQKTKPATKSEGVAEKKSTVHNQVSPPTPVESEKKVADAKITPQTNTGESSKVATDTFYPTRNWKRASTTNSSHNA